MVVGHVLKCTLVEVQLERGCCRPQFGCGVVEEKGRELGRAYEVFLAFPNCCQILLSSLHSCNLAFSNFGYLNYEATTYFRLLQSYLFYESMSFSNWNQRLSIIIMELFHSGGVVG